MIAYLGREPVDEDDASGVLEMVDECFNTAWMTWVHRMDEIFVEYGVEDALGRPTHIRCEMTVIRTRNGSWLYFDDLNLQEQAYSVDGGHTWHELVETQPESGA